MGQIIETRRMGDLSTIEIQANELSKTIVLEKAIALDAAQQAINAIIRKLPSEVLTVATVRYVMNEMKEILYCMNLKS